MYKFNQQYLMLNLQKNYLQKYQQIYPQNPQWNAIQYKLQLNLGNASVELKRVYSIVNAYLNNQFEKQNKGFITSQSYLKPDELPQYNRIQRVCQKGFQFNYSNQNGMIFSTGQIQDHQLLIVKICPRKTFPVVQSEQTTGQEYKIPQGFDSLYYKQSQEDQEIFRHKFRINNKYQTLPYYLVQFSFNNAHKQKFKKIICQKCTDRPATHYCVTQKTYFCIKCDFQHHKDKISSKHERKPLSQKPILNFGYCYNHKQIKNELFCRECNLSMCINCKIYGTHSQGPMVNHQLQKINDYFMQISTKINEMDPNLQKRKDQLQELLSVVDNKIKIINKTTSDIQNQLTKMFQDSLKDLQYISRRKISFLISDQLEIRRQYDYIQWMQSFLKYQFNVLPPNSFLASWTKHLKLRKEVLNIANIPTLMDIKPNFGIYGKIKVLEDEKAQNYQQEYITTAKDKQWRNKNNSVMQIKQNQNQESKQSQTYFRKKLFSTDQKL